MNLLSGHGMATQTVTSTQPSQCLLRRSSNRFLLKNHLKPLNHQIFHRGAAMRSSHLHSLQNRVRRFNCRFRMAKNTAPLRFCQVANEANGKIGAPYDSIRLRQGRVKNQDSATERLAKYVTVQGSFAGRWNCRGFL